MPRQALLQLVAGAAGQLQGGGVARLDLQPQPRQAAPVRPGGQGAHAAQADAASPLLRAHPVGKLGAVPAVEHEPQASDQPVSAQHAIGGPLPSGRIPLPQRRPGIVQGIRTCWPRRPQGWGLFVTCRLDQQRGIILDQRPQAQVPKVKLRG